MGTPYVSILDLLYIMSHISLSVHSRHLTLNMSKIEVLVVVQQSRTQLVSMRTQVRSLASLSGLRMWHRRELWCRSQMWLRPGVAVA